MVEHENRKVLTLQQIKQAIRSLERKGLIIKTRRVWQRYDEAWGLISIAEEVSNRTQEMRS